MKKPTPADFPDPFDKLTRRYRAKRRVAYRKRRDERNAAKANVSVFDKNTPPKYPPLFNDPDFHPDRWAEKVAKEDRDKKLARIEKKYGFTGPFPHEVALYLTLLAEQGTLPRLFAPLKPPRAYVLGERGRARIAKSNRRRKR